MLTDNNLLKLMTWNSPNFPIGSFVYSHGLEYSVEIGLVNDQPSLVNWIEGIILFGSGRVDASLLKAAYTAFEKENYSLLNKIVERADTQKSTKEFSLESKTQGSTFLKTLIKICPNSKLDIWENNLEKIKREPAFPVSFGVACSIFNIPMRQSILVFLNSIVSNLVSAGIRLIPLGQIAGQKSIISLEEVIIKATSKAMKRDIEDFGSAALVVDWTSMKHETQYTRLFRS